LRTARIIFGEGTDARSARRESLFERVEQDLATPSLASSIIEEDPRAAAEKWLGGCGKSFRWKD
jgi:hypothetical protein